MNVRKWETFVLGDLCQITSSKRIFSEEYVNVGIPFYRSKEIIEKALGEDITEYLFIPKERYYEIKINFGAPQKGDVLISSVGNRSGIPYIVKDHDGDFYFKDGNVIWFKDFNKKINSKYLSYWLKSSLGQNALNSIMIGSAQKALTIIGISNLSITLPHISIQECVADILSSLDDKIEVNRRMNATLESMARAVFRQWFVENEEVRKWEVGLLRDIAYIVKGVSYRSVDLVEESDTALVTLKSMERGGGYREDGLKPYAGDYKPGQKLSPGEVVIAHTDLTQAAEVIGRAARIETSEKHPNLVASLDMAIVRPKEKPYTNEYLYGVLSQVEFSDHAYGYTNGTTVLHLSTKALPEYQFRIPPKNKVEEFSELVSPIFLQIDNNKKQSRTLASLRDGLLPKLMRGEVRVKDVEEKI